MNTVAPMRIGITQGDPKGVGPELVAAALAKYARTPGVVLRGYGDPTLRGPNPSLNDAEAGKRSAVYVAAAVRDVLAGRLDAVVTAPINKHRWQLAGIPVPGHTEWLAHCVDEQNPPPTRMLAVSPRWKVALATLHVPLAEVPAALTADGLARTCRLTHTFLQTRYNIPLPKLAVLGLNPHAGENGQLGHEERKIIVPVLEILKREGINVQGPFPADTFFAHHGNQFDCVVAMYHDQGLIPVKTLDAARTVNVTMGLPFVRTSVGHGTGEDIAGKGVADPQNLFAAIETAILLCRRSTQRRET